MTEAIYLEVSEKTEAAKKAGRRVSVSGMLKFLGVSRSGYLAWLHHVPSDTEKRRKAVKAKIQDIYDDSKQNYGAPKITVELRKTGEVISERTVGTYMRQMGIRAQWSKPWTITTKDSDFSTELQNILDEQFNPDRPNAVWCSDITYIWTIDGFVYLTSVMDLFSRKIIAWTLSETLEVSCVIDTINNIVKTPEGAAVDNDGQLTSINAESYASMNMWGLTPEFMQILENGFKEFFANMGDKDILKAEYLLPIYIDELLQAGKVSVKVLDTNDKWFGVTYKEDKDYVVKSFAKLIEDGVYQKNLFEDLK